MSNKVLLALAPSPAHFILFHSRSTRDDVSVYTGIWWLVKLPNSLVTSPDPKEDDIDAKIGLDVEEPMSFGQYRLADAE